MNTITYIFLIFLSLGCNHDINRNLSVEQKYPDECQKDSDCGNCYVCINSVQRNGAKKCERYWGYNADKSKETCVEKTEKNTKSKKIESNEEKNHINTSKLESNIESSKNKCNELGFKYGTEKFGNCVLKLSK